MSDPLKTRVTANRNVWVFALVAVVLLINLPAVWSAWTSYRLNNAGVTTVAQVTVAKTLPEGSSTPRQFFLTYRLPYEIDKKQRDFTAEVTRSRFYQAQATPTIEVTYLAGKPTTHKVEDQVTSKMGIYLVVGADLALLIMVLLALRFSMKPEKPLVLLATSDVTRARPGVDGPGFEVREDGDEYVVRGDVLRIEDGEVVLHVGEDREVRVVLGDCANPVGHQQPAQVRGRRMTE